MHALRNPRMNAYRRYIAMAVLSMGIIPSIGATQAAADLNLGRLATPEEVAGWSISVFPDGEGYPPGRGSVAEGAALYQTHCLACHGVNLEGGGPALGPALAGGQDSLASQRPLKTIGSYWPYASTVFDYVRRTMPFQAPQSLNNDEVYSLTAYLLHKNGILPEDATVDAAALKNVIMPNAAGFYEDDRPDTRNVRCMRDCL